MIQKVNIIDCMLVKDVYVRINRLVALSFLFDLKLINNKASKQKIQSKFPWHLSWIGYMLLLTILIYL